MRWLTFWGPPQQGAPKDWTAFNVIQMDLMANTFNSTLLEDMIDPQNITVADIGYVADTGYDDKCKAKS